MTGQRKVVLVALGLGALLVVGALAAWAHLPQDGVETLAWSIVVVTGTGLGANVGEHWSRRGKTPPTEAT